MLQKCRANRHTIILFLILLLTAFLTVWKIWQVGDANAYYTAAVCSMLQSWHNFFFASFDPGGFISVDKPPLGLWLQALSGLAFGVHGWSMVLPEALCSVASVAALHHLVRRSFGEPAGLIAALALALTPIFIAVSRTNELDSSLVLVMLLAAWAAVSAAERGSLWILLLAMALLGLGFNIKMLQAWMVLPALLTVYLFTAGTKLWKRLANTVAAVAVLLAVSLSWAVIVDTTPADSRPYVGSSGTNSVLELALGYNGIDRILPGGNSGGSRGLGGGLMQPQQSSGQSLWGQVAQSIANGQTDIPGGMNEGGVPGALRLFNGEMAGQSSWLLPFSLVGLAALALALRRKAADQTALRHLLLWAGWVLPMLLYFSIAGFFHRYYLCVLAPGLAALCGIGTVLLWRWYQRGGWKAWLLPAALGGTAATQCILLSRYQGWGDVLIPIIGLFAGGGALALALGLLFRNAGWQKAVPAIAALGLSALLAAPAAWCCTPLLYGTQAMLPIAGPELAGYGPAGMRGRFAGGMPHGNPGEDGASAALIRFLTEHNSGEKYLAAVPDANTAAPIILATGKPVMAVGGFLGTDKALTVEKLERMVKDGELRYFLVGIHFGGPNEITGWVMQHGKEVQLPEEGGFSGRSRGTLYDLS